MSARRVRTPTILQSDALQCGAVSLGIVLAHHGRWVPVEELARACGVSRNGARAGDLVRAARRYGLRAQGFRAEPAALRGMPLPLLLHWDFNHFLVLEGFARNGRVHVNDPATGPRTVGADELDRSMTGVVIALEPDDSFRPAGEAPRPLRSLRRRAAEAAGGMVPVLLAGLALTAAGLAAPLLARAFVDGVLLEGRRGWLLPILLALAGLAGASALLTWRQANALLRLERRLALGAAGRFLDHLLRLPVVFFDRNYTGALSERVALNDRVARFLCRDLAVNAVAGVLAVLFLALMLRYSPALAAVAVAVVSGNLVALRWVARRRADATQRLLQEEMKLNGTALLGLRTIETVKATASENDLFARWSGYQARLVNARQRLTRATHLLEALPPFLAALSTALVLGIGALEVMDGRMTLGGLLAFQLLVAGFLAPANRLVGLAGRLETAEGDVRRLDEVLEHAPELPPLEAEPTADAEAAAIRGLLELREVVFGFAALDPPLLEGVDLRLAPGRRVTLVGKTGSGKSTLARLAAGIYAPWSGRVLLDGRPREAHPRAAIVRAVAVVDQEIALFGGTVRDNLTLWDEDLPAERMEAAARDACIHDEIEARGGYGAAVEERGANWSGGQRQRLEIARALAGDPAVLVLDEATSALDAETEARIDAALRRRGCACLVVAHRLSTVRGADEIVVLEEGRVVERGTHDALYARSGAYRRLLEAE